MRRIIRDSTSDFLLIISLMISFIILLYLVPLYDKLLTIQEETDGYRYARYYDVDLSRLLTEDGIVDLDDKETIARSREYYFSFLEQLGQLESGNIYNFASLTFTEGVSYGGARVLLRQNEKLLENFEDGVEETAAIVLDHEMDNFVEKNRLLLGGVKYDVDGYYEATEETYGLLYVNLKRLDEEHRTYLMENMYEKSMELPTMFYIAGENDVTESWLKLEQLCEQYGVEYEDVTEEMTVSAGEDYYKSLNKFSFAAALGLALINCTQVSLLWIKRKRREMAVRKAFGYNNIQLYLENVKSLFKLVFIAVFFSLAVYLVLFYLERRIVILESEELFSPIWMSVVLAGVILITLITSIPIMRQIIKTEPARGIARWQ